MILDSTTKLLKGVLSGAASPAPQSCVAYRDIDQNGRETYGSTQIVFDGSTEITMAAAPGEATARKIESIDVHNADNAQVTLSIFVDDGTTNWIVFKGTLETLESVNWTPGSGWRVLEADGGLKQQVA